MPLSPSGAEPKASRGKATGNISGKTKWPHCFAASTAICSHLPRLFSASLPPSFTTLRSAATGRIEAAPSSVAFCTSQSNRSFLIKATMR